MSMHSKNAECVSTIKAGQETPAYTCLSAFASKRLLLYIKIFDKTFCVLRRKQYLCIIRTCQAS